jgi:hypothetical protein
MTRHLVDAERRECGGGFFFRGTKEGKIGIYKATGPKLWRKTCRNFGRVRWDPYRNLGG